MSTPIEDRVAALELWRTGTADPDLAQLVSQASASRAVLQDLTDKVTKLEAEYADATKRYQVALASFQRLRVILSELWSMTAGGRDGYLASLPPEKRMQRARELESIMDVEQLDKHRPEVSRDERPAVDGA